MLNNVTGTFPSGESRLLFSSAQVDYLRYWLHAMKLTKAIIPLPYSDCLLTKSNLRTVSPIVYANGGSLKQAIKVSACLRTIGQLVNVFQVIDKNNKRLKGSNPLVTHRRHLFERVRTFWAEKRGVWCALDFESWERDHTVLTEFGWSLLGWKDGTKVEECGHLIVEEAKRYTNSQYVPDYRYVSVYGNFSSPSTWHRIAQNYNFGTSEIVKKAVFKTRIHNLIDGLADYGPVFLIFHDNSQDIKSVPFLTALPLLTGLNIYRDLKTLGVELAGLSYILPDAIPESQIFVIDTSDLIGALLGEGSGSRRGLQKTCHLLQIRTDFLHNAGNDAHVSKPIFSLVFSADPPSSILLWLFVIWPKETLSISNEIKGGPTKLWLPEWKLSSNLGRKTATIQMRKVWCRLYNVTTQEWNWMELPRRPWQHDQVSSDSHKAMCISWQVVKTSKKKESCIHNFCNQSKDSITQESNASWDISVASVYKTYQRDFGETRIVRG